MSRANRVLSKKANMSTMSRKFPFHHFSFVHRAEGDSVSIVTSSSFVSEQAARDKAELENRAKNLPRKKRLRLGLK